MKVITGAGRFTPPDGSDANHWAEQLSVADLSVGTYSIPAGGADDQVPHTEDEIYVVTAGRAVLQAGGDSAPVGPGSVVYVAARSSLSVGSTIRVPATGNDIVGAWKP